MMVLEIIESTKEVIEEGKGEEELYSCILCGYRTPCSRSYKRHCQTRRHQQRLAESSKPVAPPPPLFVNESSKSDDVSESVAPPLFVNESPPKSKSDASVSPKDFRGFSASTQAFFAVDRDPSPSEAMCMWLNTHHLHAMDIGHLASKVLARVDALASVREVRNVRSILCALAETVQHMPVHQRPILAILLNEPGSAKQPGSLCLPGSAKQPGSLCLPGATQIHQRLVLTKVKEGEKEEKEEKDTKTLTARFVQIDIDALPDFTESLGASVFGAGVPTFYVRYGGAWHVESETKVWGNVILELTHRWGVATLMKDAMIRRWNEDPVHLFFPKQSTEMPKYGVEDELRLAEDHGHYVHFRPRGDHERSHIVQMWQTLVDSLTHTTSHTSHTTPLPKGTETAEEEVLVRTATLGRSYIKMVHVLRHAARVTAAAM
jgi:hypothetical protein